MSEPSNNGHIHYTIIDYYELFVKTRDFVLTLLVIGVFLMIVGIIIHLTVTDIINLMNKDIEIIFEKTIPDNSILDLIGQSMNLLILNGVSVVLFTVIGFLLTVFSSGISYITIIRGKKKKQAIIESHHELIHREYFLNFELIGHEGNTRLDKIFNHVSMVFPELKKTKTYKRFLKGKTVQKMSQRKIRNKINKTWKDYDLAIKTISGVFIFKNHETMNFSQLKNMIEDINDKQFVQKFFNEPVIRVICVAKSFDDSIKNETFEEEFLKISKKGDYKLDLIEEHENNYSTIWID